MKETKLQKFAVRLTELTFYTCLADAEDEQTAEAKVAAFIDRHGDLASASGCGGVEVLLDEHHVTIEDCDAYP